MYNVWWLTGLHWTNLNIDATSLTDDAEDAIIFKFNYTENR